MLRSRDRPVTFPNLIPGQTYLAFTEKGSVLQKSDGLGAYEIFSRNDSFQEAYLMVADNAGTLKVGYPGDEVCTYVRMCVRVCMCGVCGQLSKLCDTHAWLMPISIITIHYK